MRAAEEPWKEDQPSADRYDAFLPYVWEPDAEFVAAVRDSLNVNQVRFHVAA